VRRLLPILLLLLTAACGESLVVLDEDDAPDLAAADMLQDMPALDMPGDLPSTDLPPAADMPDDLPALDMPEDMPDDMPEDMPEDMPDDMSVACTASGLAGVCIDVAMCDGDRVATPNRCPGPANIQCCTARPAMTAACDPAARPTPNQGRTAEPAGLGGCPPGMARVAAFCIDRWEAALVEVLPDGSERSWSPYYNPGAATVRAVSAPGLVPQGYIDGTRAGAACARSGKRLCSDQEWLRACQGAPPTTYPYGDTRQPGVCNDARAQHPAVEYFPNDPNPFSKITHQCLNQLPDSLDATGQNAGCVSQDGIFDMMGNLHEWTADPAGTFRGGFYVDTYRNGNGCLYRTTAHDNAHWDYSTGFRCCADP
jgi:formylglycine-generating enzyme